jgi:signal transduction histidine kinase
MVMIRYRSFSAINPHLMLAGLRQQRGQQRGQQRPSYSYASAAFFLLSASVQWTAYLEPSTPTAAFSQIDLAPWAILAGLCLMVSIVVRDRIYDATPVERDSVLDGLPDGILIVDSEEYIQEINAACERILALDASDVVGERLTHVLPEWKPIWEEAQTDTGAGAELSQIVDGETRVYELRITYFKKDSRLIVLRDITRYKKTEAELLSRQRLFENLVEIARTTSKGPTLQATLQNALDIATELTGAEYGSLFLLDSRNRVTESILARGKTPPGSRRKIVGAVMDKGLAGWAVRHQEAALIRDTVEDDRWVTLPDQPYAVRSVLVVPITSQSEVPGVLTLQHSEPNHFSEQDRALIQAASDQIALALRNAQIYEEQRRLADRQMTVYEALRTIAEHLEPGTVTHLAVDTISKLTGWETVGILVPSCDEQALTVASATGPLAKMIGSSLSASEQPYGEVYAAGKTRVLQSADEIEATLESGVQDSGVQNGGVQSAIFVPLRHAQERLGVLTVQSTEEAAFGEDEIRLAESLADAIAMAIANAHLFKAVTDERSRLEALIQSSRDGIILISTDRRILVVNEPALTYLNLPGEPHEWIYRPLSDVLDNLHQPSSNLAETTFVELHSSDRYIEESREGEVEIGSRALRWINLPVHTADAPIGRLVVLEDVTHERSLQRMRDDLTHTMVHDLRNPLNIVSGTLEMLRDRIAATPSSDTGQMLRIANHSTQRMLNLVNGILNISRLESGRLPLKLEEVSPADLVENVLTVQKPLAMEKDLELVLKKNGQLPPVSVDVELIERVLQNLVGNAIKFTPAGGTVEVAVKENGTGLQAGSQAGLQFAVRDTGPGVAEEIRHQLFEKFVTGSEAERGSGLGLAFCRMAVEAHGGRIWVENEPERGATFFFTLPSG